MNLGTATTLAGGKPTYHSTVVCEALPNNKTRLNSGGWRTVTTKKRMNQYAEAMGHAWRVKQKDGEWIVQYPDSGDIGERLQFQDNMIVSWSRVGW